MSAASQRAPSPAPSRWRAFAALLRRGLRDQWRTPPIWGSSLGLFSALIFFTWPSIEDSIGELVEGYPEGLKQAFGVGELDSVEAYFDVEMLSLIVPLAVSFLAVRTIARGISTAEERSWLDTLLATPLRRETLVLSALANAAVLSALTLLLTLALAMVAGLASGTNPSLAVTGRGLANVWPLALFFAGLAALVAGRFRGSGLVTAAASAALVAMYLFDVVGKVAEPLEPLRWVSAFRYYGSAVQDGIDPLAFVGLTLAGIALATVGAALLARRDLDG